MAKPAMAKMAQIQQMMNNMPRVISDISLLVIEPENGFKSIDEFLSMCKTANLMGLGALPIDLQRGTMEFGGKERSALLMSMRIMDKQIRGPFLCCDWINTYLDLDMSINPIPARVAAHFKAWLEVCDNMETGSGEKNRNIYRPDGKYIKDIDEGKQFMEIVKDNFSAYELERVAKEGE